MAIDFGCKSRLEQLLLRGKVGLSFRGQTEAAKANLGAEYPFARLLKDFLISLRSRDVPTLCCLSWSFHPS
jgi:hypothetical protein